MQRTDPGASPLAPESKVALSGQVFEGPTNKLAEAAADVCGIPRGSSAVLEVAREKIDWKNGAMNAPPLHHVATVTLHHQHAVPTRDTPTLVAEVTRICREVGANVAAEHKTTKHNDNWFHEIEFYAYRVDCDAVRTSSTAP